MLSSPTPKSTFGDKNQQASNQASINRIDLKDNSRPVKRDKPEDSSLDYSVMDSEISINQVRNKNLKLSQATSLGTSPSSP